MATLCLKTGGWISGLDEVWQSLGVYFATKKGTRVMRRHVGGDAPRMVDRPISPLTLIDYFAAIAEAAREEPRIRVQRMQLAAESDIANGEAVFELFIVYFPRGHLGDYSEAQDATGRIILPT